MSSSSPLRVRNLLIAVVGLAMASGAVLYFSADARRTAELRGAELMGDVAAVVMARRSSDGEQKGHSNEFISIPTEVRKRANHVYQARGSAIPRSSQRARATSSSTRASPPKPPSNGASSQRHFPMAPAPT
jgi:hypothetical protein